MRKSFCGFIMVLTFALGGCEEGTGLFGNGGLFGDGSYSVPPGPPPLEGQYRHCSFDITVPFPAVDATTITDDWPYYRGEYTPCVAISANGDKTAFAFAYEQEGVWDDPEQNTTFHLDVMKFETTSDSLLWHYQIEGTHLSESETSYDFVRVFDGVDISPDGGAVAVTHDWGVMCFTDDSGEPAWDWRGPKSDEENEEQTRDWDYRYLSRPVFTQDGRYVLVWYSISSNSIDLYCNRVVAYLLERDDGSVHEMIMPDIVGNGPGQRWNTRVETSRDGSRIAFSSNTYGASEMYTCGASNTVVQLFEDGEMLWSNEITDDEPQSYYSIRLAISDDGTRVVASGPSNKIVWYDADTGTEIMRYQLVSLENRYVENGIHLVRVSADGMKTYVIGTEHNLLYFNEESGAVPVWRTRDTSQKDILGSADYIHPQRAPFGYAMDFETMDRDGLASALYSNAGYPVQTEVSADGNVIVLYDGFKADWSLWGEQFSGHYFIYYPGLNIPFQFLAEDGQPEYDSDMCAAFDLSRDGCYVAGLAYDTDGDNGGTAECPRMAIHVWEIPPGIIMDVKSNITLTCQGEALSAGELIESITGSDEAQMSRHIVKPGRAATLRELSNLNTFMDAMLHEATGITTCVPWADDEGFSYDWPEGFHAEALPMAWETPTCLSNFIMQLWPVEMIAMGRLYLQTESDEVLLSAHTGSYLNITYIQPGK